MLVDSSRPPSAGELIALQRSGDPADKLDFLILGDGYTAAERGKCEQDARRLMGILFERAVLASRARISTSGAFAPPLPSPASRGRRWASTAVRRSVRPTMLSFCSERYVLTFDNRAFRDLASQAPYEVVEILANGHTYGGGGIFGQFSTVAADSLWAPYVFVHEFGHHLAALADEYYTSDVAYAPAATADRLEPWEPNVTALLDPATLKWKIWRPRARRSPPPGRRRPSKPAGARSRPNAGRSAPEAPGVGEDRSFTRQRDEEEKRFAAEPFAGKAGAFEGANYEAKGYLPRGRLHHVHPRPRALLPGLSPTRSTG